MFKIYKKVIIFIILGIGLFFNGITPAIASVRELQEAPGQILYQSHQTLRDNQKNSWQVVFFKRVKEDNSTKINLRLVGFPDLIEFAHPEDLSIKISSDLILKAPDIFPNETKSPAPNVGQYDFKELVNQLETNNLWLLELPLKNNKKITLKIPYFVIQDWLNVIAS